MKLEEKCYLAGIIDGEGTITLSRSHRTEIPSPEVTVTNTDYKLIEWIKETTNSGKIIKRLTKRYSHHNTAYIWKVRYDKAVVLIQEIFPWLIVKKEQAELIIAKYKQLTPRNGKYTESQLREKMSLVAQIRELNARRGKISENTNNTYGTSYTIR